MGAENKTPYHAVYIATSMDGFIADKDGGIDFLDSIPIPEGTEMGFYSFMDTVDALLMGRATFEKVLSFGVEWPYQKPVYVWSSQLLEIPKDLGGKVFPVKGSIEEILQIIHENGHWRLYVDGGRTIQSFLRADLLDEMIITVIPVLLGDGIPLFGALDRSLEFRCVKSEIFVDAIVQQRFVRSKHSSH